MPVTTSMNLTQQLLSALRLPKYTTRFELFCTTGDFLTVKCEYYPDVKQEELAAVLLEYQLVAKTEL